MTTSGGRRDLEDIGSGIAAWCERDRPDLAAAGIVELTHPCGGLSNETVIVRFGSIDTGVTGDGVSGDGVTGERLVVRLPPEHPTFPNQDLEIQARVQAAAAGAGIPTAGPVSVVTDTTWLGVPFITMPFVEGTIPGAASLFDPWLLNATAAQRRHSQHEMVRILAEIQRVDWHGAGLDQLLLGGQGGTGEQINWWADYLSWATAGDPLPRIEAILEWCRTHQPACDAPPSLVWGDPRLENLVMDQQRRTCAVLDWELATIGPAEMDLGWYLGLERVLLELTGKGPLEGMAGHDEVAADYSAAIGRTLDDLAWHEIFAVFRSICVNVRQSAISAEAGVEYLLPPGEANPLVGVAEGWITAHPGAG